MYRTLFDLAGLAMIGWLLVILLPAWRVTRRIAESAIFPVYLSVLYVVGLVTLLRAAGPGFMRDFGSADGVLGLLVQEPIALVAWIHILAFDQVVGLLIYRDNMRHRFVPLPLQSVLLLATLMLGPVGFLTYWAVRTARTRRAVAWGEREPEPAAAPTAAAVPAPRFAAVAAAASPIGVVAALWRRERALVALGVAGFALATVCAVVAAVNGGWLLEPEGRLLEAAKFDTALGIYYLSLALVLPFAPFTPAARRRWVRATVGLGVFAFAMENVQAWRGLDPRFSSVAGPVDQMLGGIFFLSALGIMVLFIILLGRFFRSDALPDHAPLRFALRYAAGAAMIAFAVGIVMSVAGGRLFAGVGNMMPIHAAGFHGLQAVPIVALLFGAAAVGRRATHIAGVAWLLLCIGLVAQAFAGRPPLQPGPALWLSLAAGVVWLGAVLAGVRARFGAPDAAPQAVPTAE